ncbi:hypothetical protein HN371_08585 [Candidatus Poribacteria bacterium]|nr:hypothetical protein [Candidatus Poribacteria bacterium]MBT7098066.1 hypothetical protein [Candidatus Poribacteria bacterium]
MPYNASLAVALGYLEISGGIDASSTPTTTQATAMWNGVYTDLLAMWGACGVTIAAGTNSELKARDIEAMLTSAKVGEANEIQNEGVVSEHTRFLLEQGNIAAEKMCGYEYALSLGATVVRKGPRPRSMATKYPNEALDTTDYESPLQDVWERDMDL